ncbi:hypothetical protein MBLNU230_g1472t1 [Neophaeotheca triangularis]
MARTRQVPGKQFAKPNKHSTADATVDKENIRPATSKKKPKSKSIAGLFMQRDKAHTSSKHSKVGKFPSSPDKTKRSRKTRPEHPMLTSFKKTTTTYRIAAAGSTISQLAPIHQDLLDLLHAATPDSDAQDQQTAELENSLAHSMASEALDLQIALPNGETETRTATLGQIMALFRGSVEKRSLLLGKLQRELGEVEGAIGAAGLDLVEGKEVREALRELEVAEAGLGEALEREEAEFAEEVREARREDRERTRERNRRIKAFVLDMS